MKNEYLEAGRICTAHGVKGALKIEHICDSASVLSKQKTVYFGEKGGFRPIKVISASASDRFVIMTLEGVASREDAIALRGKTVFLKKEDVPCPAGAMFIADMIGIDVVDAASGERYGILSDVSDVAGRRIYTVRTDGGEEVLLPDVKEFIKEISPDGMKITPIPGFFDDADEV